MQGRFLREMIISMRLHATREEIDHVRERICELGFRVHSIEGDERVVIGVVGVGGDVEACLESLEATPGVERAVRISAPYKFVSREFRQEKTIIRAGKAEIGSRWPPTDRATTRMLRRYRLRG